MHAARLIVVDLALATLAEIAFREQLWLLVLQLAVRIRHELIVAYLSITSLISPVCTGTIASTSPPTAIGCVDTPFGLEA